MAKVKLIDGRIIDAQLTNVHSVGEEGSRAATAHFEGKMYDVYNSIVDGFDPVWNEQMDYETYKALGTGGFVEGTIDEYEHRQRGEQYQNEKDEKEARRDTLAGGPEEE